jgi:hypothetical protein
LVNAYLNKADVLKTQSFRNICKNSFFRNWTAGAAAAPDHWEIEGAGVTISREVGCVGGGYPFHCRVIVAVGNNGSGLKQALTEMLGGLSEAPIETMRLWIRRISGGTALRLKLEGSIAATSDITLTDEWERFVLTGNTDVAGTCPSAHTASILCNSADATTFELAGVLIHPGDVAFTEHEDDDSQHAKLYEPKVFYVRVPATAANKAKWTPQEDIVIRRIDAFAATGETGGPGCYVRYTITDGSSPIYAEIANGTAQGSWTGNQKYAKDVELTLSTAVNAGENQADATCVIAFQRF